MTRINAVTDLQNDALIDVEIALETPGREQKGPAVALNQQAFLDARLGAVAGTGADALPLRPFLPTPLFGTGFSATPP